MMDQSFAVDTRWQWIAACSEDEERVASESPALLSRGCCCCGIADRKPRGRHVARKAAAGDASAACDSACRAAVALAAACCDCVDCEPRARHAAAMARKATAGDASGCGFAGCCWPAAVALLAAAAAARWTDKIERRWRLTSNRNLEKVCPGFSDKISHNLPNCRAIALQFGRSNLPDRISVISNL